MKAKRRPFILQQGKCEFLLRGRPADSVGAVVTDPPYGIQFRGEAWDRGVPSVQIWEEILRVLKPGGWALIFASPKMDHRLAVNVEDAGFEICDRLYWMHAQGMPKGRTTLAPAVEPIILARKPGKPLRPLNIDACRIPCDDKAKFPVGDYGPRGLYGKNGMRTADPAPNGRWPKNAILDEGAALLLDAQAGIRKSGARRAGVRKGMGYGGANGDGGPAIVSSSGSASRFFFVAKARHAERKEGGGHPTQKPLQLMRYLVRLVAGEGPILDPFMGSGTTGVACIREGIPFVGIEENAAYLATTRLRLEKAAAHSE